MAHDSWWGGALIHGFRPLLQLLPNTASYRHSLLPPRAASPARLGLIGYEELRSRWRYVALGILVVTAVVTPDPTPISTLLLSAPRSSIT
ncbi:MAG: hypothetical protein DRK00_00845 [Thermoprotei archaeon]|nr:MAG: hypothetical protein DRK00_00845 [Thermoprotei archaeon]